MKQQKFSGQGMTEYGLVLAFVALVVLAVILIVNPAIGETFRKAADNAVNSDVSNIGYRLTQTIAAATRSSTPTSTPIGWLGTPATTTPTPTATLIPTSTNTTVPTSIPTATLTPTNTATPVPTWQNCASEWGTCTFTGTSVVKYGAFSSWYYLTVTGTTPCTNDIFDDPLFGTGKACYYWTGTWPLTITGVSPVSGSTAGGTSVTVTGTGLLMGAKGAATIFFGSNAATVVSCAADFTSCSVTSPSGSAGSVNVSAAIGGQTAVRSSAYTYQAPPGITSITPNTGPLAGISVTITGSGFVTGTSGTAFTFGGTAATAVNCTSTTSCTVTAPAHTAGAVDVVATVGTLVSTLTGGFTYTAAPTLVSLSVTSGSFAGGTSIATITGTGFSTTAGATTFSFGGSAATGVSCSSTTTCTATTPSHAAGTVNVVVTVGGQTGTLTNGFTYVGLALSSVTPTSGPATSTTAITNITGTSFSTVAGATTFTFGGTPATGVSCSSSTTCTATAPVHAAGAVDVVVTVAGQTATLTGGFTYIAAPTITTLSTSTGPIAGGTVIATISGTGFSTTAGATTFSFGGSAATGVSCSSTTACSATTPAHAAGAVNVVVTVNGQTGTLTNGFTYAAPPTITTLNTTTGPVAGGTVITTISGTGFSTTAGATVFTFDGVNATSISCSSSTSCSATTPAHVVGPVDVMVTVNGMTDTLTNGFTYYGMCTVTLAVPTLNQNRGAYYTFTTTYPGPITADWYNSTNSVAYFYPNNPLSSYSPLTSLNVSPPASNRIATTQSGTIWSTGSRAAGQYTIYFYTTRNGGRSAANKDITYWSNTTCP